MKLNIHKKVLILVLGTGLATFLVLGIFSYLSKNIVQKDMAKMSVDLGEKSASYTDEILITELKQTFGELTKAKAEYINREMEITRDDAGILAEAMTNIMSHPENYLPRTLPDPRTQPVKNGQTYLIFAPDIRDKVTPELMQEISIAANIGDLLEEMTLDYSDYNCTAFAGSVKGWYFCSRVILNDNGKAHLSVGNQPTDVSDLYMTLTGKGEKTYQQIGASAPFYDAEGNLAGVVGLDYSNEDIYEWVAKDLFTKNNMSFVLNEHGEILFSTKNIDAKIFNKATKAINKEESGVVQITTGGQDYYVAFSPVEDIGWIFCMIVSEEEILDMAGSSHNYFLQQIKNLQNRLNQDYSLMNTLSIVIPILLLIILFVMSTKLSWRFVKPINFPTACTKFLTAISIRKFQSKPATRLNTLQFVSTL